MVQYWLDSVMMGVVSEKDALEIMENSRKAGFKVIDYMPTYFVIVREEDKPRRQRKHKSELGKLY